MAVPCPRCGREYDVTLFEFGRTLWCTCGSRVGLEARTRPLGPRDEPRFAVDAMLGRLARWLRLLGFDCFYDAAVEDEELVRIAVTERRILLTRDRRLPEEWWISDVHLVRAEKLGNQLVEVMRRFGLNASLRILSRCSECNCPLLPATAEQVSGRVPPRILSQHEAFAACPGCSRVYWEGSHARRIRAVAEKLGAR